MATDGRKRNETDYTLIGGSAAWVLVWKIGVPRSMGTLVLVTWINAAEHVCTDGAKPPAWVVRELRAEGAACPVRPDRAIEQAARRATRPEWRAE